MQVAISAAAAATPTPATATTMSDLPPEVLWKIFEYINHHDTFALVPQVCVGM